MEASSMKADIILGLQFIEQYDIMSYLTNPDCYNAVRAPLPAEEESLDWEEGIHAFQAAISDLSPDAKDSIIQKNTIAGLAKTSQMSSLRLKEPYTSSALTEATSASKTFFPKGDKNSPAWTTNAMQHILRPLQNEVVNYDDDFAGGDNDPNILCDKLERFLKLMLKVNAKFSPEKIKVGFTQITCLGFVADKNGIIQNKTNWKNFVTHHSRQKKTPILFWSVKHFPRFYSEFTRNRCSILSSAKEKRHLDSNGGHENCL